MRTNLIMHFHCSECGNQLNLIDRNEQETNPVSSPSLKQIPGEPTGAMCLYASTIQVEPCRHCIEKYTLPAKKMVEGIKQMADLGKKNP